MYTPRIEQAIQLAARAHHGQFRKAHHDLPYISHPFSVFTILSEHTNNESVLIASLLHDVLEDADPTHYTATSLRAQFGDEVVTLITEVSEQKTGAVEEKALATDTWQQRKDAYLAHIATASEGALLITLADKLHSLITLLTDYEERGNAMWTAFNASKEKQLWFYQTLVQAIKARDVASTLTTQLETLVAQLVTKTQS